VFGACPGHFGGGGGSQVISSSSFSSSFGFIGLDIFSFFYIL